MAIRRTLRLKTREQRELEHYRDHDARPYVRERCSAVLKIAAGETPHAVARQGVLKPRDPDTLYGWLQVYEEEGVAGLVAHQHGGDRRRLLRGGARPCKRNCWRPCARGRVRPRAGKWRWRRLARPRVAGRCARFGRRWTG